MYSGLNRQDLDALNSWWIEKSRVNFLAYRKYMRQDYLDGWFMRDLAVRLQDFYAGMVNGERPTLLIQSPPQHGKSLTMMDFVTWISGKNPKLRSIFASYSETLGVRCNTHVQRTLESEKFQTIFPDLKMNKSKVVTMSDRARRNSKQIEFLNGAGQPTGGQFRNTTTGGPITGESLDLGIIDDAVKGREQANSITWSQKIWEWYTDDFKTRFAENAGLIIIMTRWTTHDLIGRIVNMYEKNKKPYKLINYSAISTKDETYRLEGEPLFPELKSLGFLKEQKAGMAGSSWESLYQGNPTVTGGNLFKDDWWKWYKVLPNLKYKFIVVDTAQKEKKQNDWTVFQCWGYAPSGIYLIDKLRAKMEAPTLRREAEMFYRKHDTPRENLNDPILRGMYIEDKSSGTGLIQELRRKKLKVFEIPRNTDKYFRAEDVAPYIESGLVHLNVNIPGIDNLTKEAREFPNGEFDDDIDTLMSAVEISLINKNTNNSLMAAMLAPN